MTPATITPPPHQPSAPSAGVPTAPPAAPEPTPYRWTIAEYRELGKTGLFEGKKTMLIHGEIYVMATPKPPHDVSLGLTDDWLRAVFAVGFHVRNQQGFDIGTDNDPSPDLAVVVGSRRDYANRTPTAAVMIIEVAVSSLTTDLTKKAELYAGVGVPEYWVIDVDNRQLYVLRDPGPLPADPETISYRSHRVLGPADTMSPLHAPAATVTVSDLLP